MDLISIALANKNKKNSNSQDTVYSFSVKDLYGIKIQDIPLLQITTDKSTILDKGGISSNIPTIEHKIFLTTCIADLTTQEITPLFDLPMDYSLSVDSSSMQSLSIKNITKFTPLVVIPALFSDVILPMDQLNKTVSKFVTNFSYDLYSRSDSVSNQKLIGFAFKIILEFANEDIRDSFYEEFKPVLDSLSHFCLKYADYKIVESSYIGGV